MAGRSREKFKEPCTERISDDKFGGWLVGFHGSQPTAKLFPNGCREIDSEVLQETLGNTTDLYITVVGFEFSSNRLSIGFRFVVDVLIAGVIGNGFHRLHPEVISIGTDNVNGVSETEFDFEAIAVDGDDIEWGERDIGGHEKEESTGGVFDDHETHEASDRSPKKVDAAIADEHVLLSVDRTEGAGEGGRVFCKISQGEFHPVEFGPSPSWDGRFGRRPVGDGRGSDPCDEVVSLLDQRPDDLPAGVVRVGHENGPRGNPFHQLEKERNHFVQQGGFVFVLENHPFMNARGQRNRSDRTRSTPNQQRNGLERMPHDKCGF